MRYFVLKLVRVVKDCLHFNSGLSQGVTLTTELTDQCNCVFLVIGQILKTSTILLSFVQHIVIYVNNTVTHITTGTQVSISSLY